MNLFRLSTVVLLAALASACASAPKSSADAPADAVVIDSTVAAPLPPEPPIDPASIDAPAPATDVATASEGEDDFAAIYGQGAYDPVADPTLPAPAQSPVAYDPWEKFNRKVHAFNNAVDRAIARPLAKAYVAAVPRPVRLGVGNFFDNLRQPLTMVNQLLQGRPRDATQTLGRFLLNSTVGIGGIFDPASDLKMKRRSEDFGQTLGTWGWRRSRYVELPFFGPRTVRDVLGLAGDMPLSPTRYVEDDKARIFLQGLNLVDTRAQLLSLDSLREGAVDDYALVRDSWLQRRNYQIESHRTPKQTEEELPEYLQDESTPTVPADAMPMPEISGGG
jgi:phospholipid-binding lipoprotein MlaA